jgi:hypothetical protein
MPEGVDIEDSWQARSRLAAVFALSLALALLAWLSWHLAKERIYQVDECQNLFVATLLANNLGDFFMTSVSLYVVSLMLLARDLTQSAELFTAARLVALTTFWINILLLAAATGERLRSVRGLTVIAAAATLAPLWDYGLEVRHDNLLLTTLLLIWLFVRVWTWGWLSLFLIGVLSVVGEFVAFKAFVYTIPLTLFAVLSPAPGNDGASVSRLSAALAWLAGAASAAIAVRGAYAALGVWNLYTRDLAGIFAVAGGADRLTPIPTLLRVVHQSPLLVVVAAMGWWLVVRSVRPGWSRIRRAVLPEAVLVLLAFTALVMNPAPHPYNLVNLVPFLFLFGYRSLVLVLERVPREQQSAAVVVVAIALAAHVGLFTTVSVRHFSMTNDRQRTVMAAAEALTDPVKDFVYDGIGMVPTRRSINRDWLIHSLYLNKFLASPASSVREMLRQKPASVLIQSYRTDWLAPADHAFIKSRYIPLSDELWVLGTRLSQGGGTFEVVHPGRYIVVQSTDPSQAVIGAQPPGSMMKVDGQPLAGGIVVLAVGLHSIEGPADAQPSVVWIGPKLPQLPDLGSGDHRRLFVNWY